jgi:hypothetical protein
MTLLLIGIFVWIWVCMKISDWLEGKYSLVTTSVLTVVLFFLPFTLFFDFARMTT